MFVPKPGRFVRFRGLTELTTDPSRHRGAERVARRDGQQPGAHREHGFALAEHEFRLGTAVSLEGMASDPDLNLPLTYRWSVAREAREFPT